MKEEDVGKQGGELRYLKVEIHRTTFCSPGTAAMCCIERTLSFRQCQQQVFCRSRLHWSVTAFTVTCQQHVDSTTHTHQATLRGNGNATCFLSHETSHWTRPPTERHCKQTALRIACCCTGTFHQHSLVSAPMVHIIESQRHGLLTPAWRRVELSLLEMLIIAHVLGCMYECMHLTAKVMDLFWGNITFQQHWQAFPADMGHN